MKNRKRLMENVIYGIFLILGLVTVGCVLLITVYLVISGIPAIRKIGILRFLLGEEWASTADQPQYGILPFILTSVYGTAGAIFIGVPIGFMTAVYLSKIARPRVKSVIETAVSLLAGIPSVVYGLVGMMVLVPGIRTAFGIPDGASLFAAIVVLAIMILPSIIKVSLTALEAVPKEYEDASLALGATPVETYFRVSVPAAKSGIAAAVVLGVGRAIGEAMAVMMVAGNAPNMPGIFQSVRFLTTAVASEMSYAADGSLQKQALFSIALVLFLFIMMINAVLNFFLKHSKENRSKRHNKFQFPALAKAIYGSFYKAENEIFNVVNYNMHRQSISLKRKTYITVMRALMGISVGITCALVVFLIGYVLWKGIPNITWELLATKPSYLSGRIGILPDILNTVYIVAATLALVLPLGVGAAIYLTEYAKNRKLVNMIEYAAETLSGIPSIIYGLVGMLFFCQFFGMKTSLLAGAFTLVIMNLPTVMRTTQESLKTVPQSYREGAFGLGAGKWRVIRTVVFPGCIDGIITGCILSVGRILGESAALLFTAGFAHALHGIFEGLNSAGATLTVALYVYAKENGEFGIAFAIAAILMLLTVLINLSATLAGRYFQRKAHGAGETSVRRLRKRSGESV